MFRLRKRDDKKSLFRLGESLTQKPGKCNLLSNSCPRLVFVGVKRELLAGETYDWYALDHDGNVWYFGEETYERIYDEDWNWIDTNTEGSWEAGVDGALPGIVIPGNPMPGMCYQQEYYEGEAEDVGKVLKLNASVSLEYRDFESCLMTKEWPKLEPGNIEHK